jgi:hypothetical protein
MMSERIFVIRWYCCVREVGLRNGRVVVYDGIIFSSYCLYVVMKFSENRMIVRGIVFICICGGNNCCSCWH